MINNSIINLKQTLDGTDEQLYNIILAYKRGIPPFPHPQTLIWYDDGVISSFNIVGTIADTSIPLTQDDPHTYSKITKIEIGNTVTDIGFNAFRFWVNLSDIEIPESVTRIQGGAFEECNDLSSITIPKSVESIGKDAFLGCTNLSSITCEAIIAPIVDSAAFGSRIYSEDNLHWSDRNHAGYSTHTLETNVLKVHQGATGYDSGAWLDPLQNSEKCGFHIEYI